MKVAIVANDTRGGIQPYIALGRALQGAGHDVRMVAPSDFSSMFVDAGLPFAALAGGVEEAVRNSGGAAERGTIASVRLSVREMPKRILVWTREALAACEGVDLITGGVGGMVVALSVAEKLGVPFVETHLQPLGFPTDAYPGVLLSGVPRWLGAWGRRMSHHLTEAALWMPFRGLMQSARTKVLGLSGRPTANLGQPVIYAFSRHVVPMPDDPKRERHVVGYWTLPAGATWQPPPALEAFLAQPGPVVSIGFGSMASEDPARVTALVQGAVRDAGVRAVLLSGWGGLKSLPDNNEVLCADALPHDWLFPRVAAVVHHGGAGTTGAALRSGVPAIVVPFAMDQPFWGQRVAAIGAGPTPIPRRKLTQDRLSAALKSTVADEQLHSKAASLGGLIRAEDGLGRTVALLEQVKRIR